MKAIKIPNAALLDVFGRPVAIDTHDLQRASVIHSPSFTGSNDKNRPNGVANHQSHSKTEPKEQLTVIGKSRFVGKMNERQIVDGNDFSFLGETPLHIAIVYNDLNSVKLLIKHGVDVNKRVVGEFNISDYGRMKNETKKGRKARVRPLFRRSEASQKHFNPQNENPESNFLFSPSSPNRIPFRSRVFR